MEGKFTSYELKSCIFIFNTVYSHCNYQTKISSQAKCGSALFIFMRQTVQEQLIYIRIFQLITSILL